MTRAYRTFVSQFTFICPSDEAALLVRLRGRRAGLSTISGKPRAIYDARRMPLTEHVVLSLYELHREEPFCAEVP